MATKKKIEKLSDLIPDGNNYNRGTDFGGELIEKSFRRLGAGRSVLADKHGNLMAGNKAGKGFLAAGFKDEDIIVVPTDGTKLVVVQRMDLDLKTKRGKEMALADNATSAANLAWDMEALAADEWDKDELAAWGVSDWSEDAEHEGDNTKGHAQEDDFEVPEIETVTTDIQIGDLFEIGRHRLLCGDSTVAENVARLMDGEKVDMIQTDPPYGVSYVGKTKKALTIENDAMSSDQTFELFDSALTAVWSAWNDGGAIYATVPAVRLQLGFMKVLEDRDCLRQIMVWNKSAMVLGHSDYHYKHEPILYGWKPGAAHYFTSDRTQTTVFDFDKPSRNAEHPTMKPIALWGKMIENSSKSGWIVFDPFLGSGTTMVAAHQLNRTCYGIELSPQYCQVIIQRMLKLDPALPVKRNGIDETDKWLLNAE